MKNVSGKTVFRGRLRKGLHPSVVKHITEPYLHAAKNDLIHHFSIHKAHVIMLKEQKILTPDETRLILEGLSELESNDIYAGTLDVGTDLYMNLEALLINRVGEAGGKMHIGRSRNDLYATCVRMVVRDQILTTADLLSLLVQVILEVARTNCNTVMPGYTHWQHAQPVTLAHYLTGITQALGRDLERLIAAYEHTNQCPLGAGALATTGFPINRERVAFLLGFDGILENSYDAVASRDFLAEATSALAILMTTVSRLAEDLIIWNTFEFSVLDMPEEFSGTSSIMPQKKNPFVLEHIKGRAGHAIAAVTDVLTILKGSSFSHNREVSGETTTPAYNAFRLVHGCLEMLIQLFPQLSFNKELMSQRAAQGFSTVTELADLLVREKGISFRQAHHIIGRVINELLDKSQPLAELSSAMINETFHEIMGYKLGLSEEDVRKSLDVRYNVGIREVAGGPGLHAMETLISHQEEKLKRKRNWLSRCQSNLENARKACEEAQSKALTH
ncbi:MAG: argininosuccinate lyase [Candidatus Hodarchaeota archaeon]